MLVKICDICLEQQSKMLNPTMFNMKVSIDGRKSTEESIDICVMCMDKIKESVIETRKEKK